MSKSTIVSQTTAALHSATGFDARHLPDVEKAIAGVYDAAARDAAPSVHVAALTDAEILLFRDAVRARITPLAKKKK